MRSVQEIDETIHRLTEERMAIGRRLLAEEWSDDDKERARQVKHYQDLSADLRALWIEKRHALAHECWGDGPGQVRLRAVLFPHQVA